jgi:hypothetical protein
VYLSADGTIDEIIGFLKLGLKSLQKVMLMDLKSLSSIRLEENGSDIRT